MKRIVKSWWNGFKKAANWYANQYSRLYMQPII